MSYYHGGIAGLKVGDRILPPAETGSESLSEYGAHGIHRRDRVYLGNTIGVAILYAAMRWDGLGDLYEVEPEGPIEEDPDWNGDPGVSVQTTSARVVRVIEGNTFRLDDGTSLMEVRDAFLTKALDEPVRHRTPGRNDPCPCQSGRKYKRCHG